MNPTTAAGGSSGSGAEELRVRGNSLFKAGNWQDALMLYRQAAASKDCGTEERVKCMGNACVCLHKLKKYDECRRTALEVLQLNAFYAKAYGFVGMCLFDEVVEAEPPKPLEPRNGAQLVQVYTAYMWMARAVALQPSVKDAQLSQRMGQFAQIAMAGKHSIAPSQQVQQASPHLSVSSVPGRGRGIITQSHLTLHELVVPFGEPLSVGPLEPSSMVCLRCGATPREGGTFSVQCPACHVYYCNEACASAYSQRHARECAAFIKLREVITKMDDGDRDYPDLLYEVASHTITTLSAMEEYVGAAPQDVKALLSSLEGHDEEVAQALHPTVPLLAELYPLYSEKLLAHVVGVLRCNTFEVCDASGLSVGAALYGGIVPLFNHSCCPNAALDLEKKVIYTIRPVEPLEEITISYIPQLYHPTRLRRSALAERFYFTCDCARCGREAADPFERVLSAALPTARPNASEHFTPLVMNVVGAARSATVEEVDTHLLTSLQEQLADLRRELFPLHYLIQDCRNALVFVETVLQKKQQVREHCLEELQVWECIVPGAHPVKADKLRNVALSYDEEGGGAPSDERLQLLQLYDTVMSSP